MNGASTQAPEPQAPSDDASAPESPPQNAAQAQGEQQDPSEERKPESQVSVERLRAGLSDYGRRNKALVEALGLSKDTTTEDALAAIATLKARASAAGTGDDYELPPEILEREQVLLERSWAAANRDFGEELVQSTQGLRDLVMNTSDPYELTQALHEMMSQVAQPKTQDQGQQAKPPAQPQAASAQASQQPRGVDMEVGRAGWIAQPDDTDKPGTGDTRGFFQRVFGQQPR